ncbi:AAA ATPase midasin [Batrachochytrium dendrobatidis]
MQSVCDKSEQHGFLLDLAPRIAMLLSHPTLIASLQKHEFALLSSVMDPLCSNISGQDPLHNRISHEQLNLLLQILSYLLLRPSMTPDICHLFRPIVIDLVARWLLFPATEYESALGKNIDFSIVSSANTTTAMMASVSISPATLVETSSLKHTRDGVEIKSISSTSKAFDPSVVFVEYLAAAFSCLLPIVPQVKAHAITAFKNSPSLFSAVEYLSKNPSVESTSRLTAIVKSMYRLLDFSRNVFSGIWDHAALYTLLDYPDDTVRIYTAHSLAVLVGMSDAQRSVF